MPGRTLLSLLAAAALGCAGPAREDCPVAPQMGCPAGAWSYDSGIGTLLGTRCSPCHAAGGVQAKRLLTDYQHAFGQRISIGSQLVTCSMPPPGAPPLEPSERQRILDWLTCGAPQ